MTEAHDADRTFWDGFAAHYAAGGGRKTPALLDEMVRGASTPTRCVDLACGPGRTTARLAARFPHAEVTGVDLSPEMLAHARAEHPTLTFVEGRDTALPFDDDSIDLVTISLGLMLFPEATAALHELRRVLAPGGEVRVGVWGRPELTNFPTFGVKLATRLGHPIPSPPRSNFHLGTPRALHAAAEGTGLDVREARHWTLPFPYASAADACRDLDITLDGDGMLREALGDRWEAFVPRAEAEAARLLAEGEGVLVMDTLIGVLA